jgi:hypothetical protein
MYCQVCSDIVCPESTPMQYRHCKCKRHAVWWRNPTAGQLSVWDRERRLVDSVFTNEDGATTTYQVVISGWAPAVWVLGMTNSWLTHPKESLNKQDYEDIIEAHPTTYLFKTLGSVAIRIRPGFSSDTKWDDLPQHVVVGLTGVQMPATAQINPHTTQQIPLQYNNWQTNKPNGEQ